jgi:hypothetical protein
VLSQSNVRMRRAILLLPALSRQTADPRVASQSSGTLLARPLPAPGLGRPGGEFAQEGQLALTDDTLRIVGIGANYAASTSIVVRDRKRYSRSPPGSRAAPL